MALLAAFHIDCNFPKKQQMKCKKQNQSLLLQSVHYIANHAFVLFVQNNQWIIKKWKETGCKNIPNADGLFNRVSG